MSHEMQVALDSLRMLGVVIEAEQLEAFVAAMREFHRLDHCFDNGFELRFVDFAQRDHGRAITALRLITDLGQSRARQIEKASRGAETLLDYWRAHAREWGFVT